MDGVLPERVQEALGQLVGAAKEGLLALSVGVGLGVLTELMEAEVDEVVGAKHRHNPERVAVRHGHEDGEVTLGGRRVAVRRPRARTADDEHEVPLRTYEYFADRDPLARVVMERMLAGVSPDVHQDLVLDLALLGRKLVPKVHVVERPLDLPRIPLALLKQAGDIVGRGAMFEQNASTPLDERGPVQVAERESKLGVAPLPDGTPRILRVGAHGPRR